MRSIDIPKFYTDKLADKEEALLVQQYLSTFDDWYYLNDTVFFREYTDHGPKHIKEVLSTAEQLLTDESKEQFSPADSALLICSTLLHDFAMHLQAESFVFLATSERSPIGANDFGDKSWARLWKDYVSEMHRLTDNSRMNLFGFTAPIEPPDLQDTDNWTKRHNRYIGEFVRRHHPRLAYEITLNGIPGTQGTLPIDNIKEGDPNYRLSMLAGIVARSHGMGLRDTFDVLSRDYHLRVFQQDCHPIYVMVLLRIADYIQLQSTRAPEQLLKIKRLKSPLSQSEWGLHDAIQGVSFDIDEDPEVLHVQVDPKKSDVESYLKTHRLLGSIQRELDQSWAVLGEVYGRYQKWGITIRRIRSNIENKDDFGRSAGFIPEEVKFTSANTELTKLLIKPLYGDYPEIAVRELVQNAIDACRERAFIEGAKDEGELGKYVVKVELVNNPDGTKTLRVSDTGIGMTLDVLKRYFLNAGSSFRTSLAWKKRFANDKAKSEVLRSGRFGVGALAAFLVADDPSEILLSVKSRYINAAPYEAVSFETSLSDAPISVHFENKQEVGTVISVTTSSPPSFMRSKESEEKEGASWDWYCLDWPRVERSLSTGKALPQKYRLPTKFSDRTTEGIRTNFIQPEGFESVCWYYGDGHQVVCNGIRVIEKQRFSFPFSDNQSVVPKLFEEKTIIGPHILNFPNISVMDKDGLLPLTLDRLRLDFDQIPFMRELREDVRMSLVCGLALSAPTAITEKSFKLAEENLKTVLSNFSGMKNSSISWLIAKGGVSLLSGRSINQIRETRIIELSSPQDIQFIKDPSDHALLLTQKSVYATQRLGAKSGKHLHFLADKNARERFEHSLKYVLGDIDQEYERSRRSDRVFSFEEEAGMNHDFIAAVKSGFEGVYRNIKSMKRKISDPDNWHDSEIAVQDIKDLEDIIQKLEDYARTDNGKFHRFARSIFRDVYKIFGGHSMLGALLSSLERKQEFSPLDAKDGRRLIDAISAISDSIPRLKKNESRDYDAKDCPVDWDRVLNSLNHNNEDWFLASWVLQDDLDVDAGFLGQTWYALFGTDFIPLSDSDRGSFLNSSTVDSNALKHLERWREDLAAI